MTYKEVKHMEHTEKLTLRDIKPRKTKLDGITDEQLANDRSRMSVGYMAQQYGVSKATLYRRLRKAGLVHGQAEQSKSNQ